MPWKAALVLRMRRLFLLKVVGTTVAIGLFFVVYLHLLHHPSYPVTTMPLTALDRFIPFAPQGLFVYLTLWLYVGVGPGLQLDASELVGYAWWIGLLCAAGLLIFHFWPTQVPPMHIDVSHLPGFAWLKGIDAAGNACPSMHVAIATFTMLRLRDVWKRTDAPEVLRSLNLIWCAAIIASTLLTKQHVVVDAICGALLGSIFAGASLRRAPGYERTARTA
jgi:hypothetical protein